MNEENRADIRDGDIFTITQNVELTAAKFLSDIEQPDQAIKRKALQVSFDKREMSVPVLTEYFSLRNNIGSVDMPFSFLLLRVIIVHVFAQNEESFEIPKHSNRF